MRNAWYTISRLVSTHKIIISMCRDVYIADWLFIDIFNTFRITKWLESRYRPRMRSAGNLQVTADVMLIRSDERREVRLIPHSFLLGKDSTHSPTYKSDCRCMSHQHTQNYGEETREVLRLPGSESSVPFLTQLHTTGLRIAAFTEAKNSLPWRRKAVYIVSAACALAIV